MLIHGGIDHPDIFDFFCVFIAVLTSLLDSKQILTRRDISQGLACFPEPFLFLFILFIYFIYLFWGSGSKLEEKKKKVTVAA